MCFFLTEEPVLSGFGDANAPSSMWHDGPLEAEDLGLWEEFDAYPRILPEEKDRKL